MGDDALQDIARGRSLTLNEAKAIVGPMVDHAPAELQAAKRMLETAPQIMRIGWESWDPENGHVSHFDPAHDPDHTCEPCLWARDPVAAQRHFIAAWTRVNNLLRRRRTVPAKAAHKRRYGRG